MIYPPQQLCYYGSSAWQIAVASLSGRYIEYNDPYLQVMSRYPKVPRYWYAVVLVLSVSMSLLTFYQGGFQLPWWGFAVFFILALVLTYPNGEYFQFHAPHPILPPPRLFFCFLKKLTRANTLSNRYFDRYCGNFSWRYDDFRLDRRLHLSRQTFGCHVLLCFCQSDSW